MAQKTIAFFPEAAYGPALNSVGIAQAVEARGHKAVFLSDPGFVDVYQGYGFEAHPVNLSAPMPPEQMAKFWEDFINGHIPNFRKSPYDQVDNYVKDCWTAIVDSAKWAQKDLPGVLARIKPDVICVDNVILFPAIKQYGKPWVRIISCSENEIEDEGIPPHLSGCGEDDHACHKAYRDHFNAVIKPIHDDFNEFLNGGRGALSDRAILRGLALSEPAALSGGGEVQPHASARPEAVPVSRRAACARRRPTRCRPSRRTMTGRCSMSRSARSAPAIPIS